MPGDTHYWFRAKRYGWGWGFPSSWQGWAVLFAFLALVVLAAFVFPPERRLGLYLSCVGVLAILFLGICWRKGEPPRRRWGGDESD